MLISIFDIALLQEAITSELSPLDLRHCALVCRSWYSSFRPLLWQGIKLERRGALKSFRTPQGQAKLWKHSRQVLSLTTFYPEILPELTGDLKWRYRTSDHDQDESEDHRGTGGGLLDFERPAWLAPVPVRPVVEDLFKDLVVLKSLVLPLRPTDYAKSNQHLHDLFDFVESHPRLKVLEMSHFWYVPKMVERLASVMEDHPGLEEFALLTPLDDVPMNIYRMILLNIPGQGQGHGLIKFTFSGLVRRSYGPTRLEEARRGIHEMKELTRLKSLDLSGVELSFPEDVVTVWFLSKCTALESWICVDMTKNTMMGMTTWAFGLSKVLKELDLLDVAGQDEILMNFFQEWTPPAPFVPAQNPTGPQDEWTTLSTLWDHGEQDVVFQPPGLRSFRAGDKTAVGWKTMELLVHCHRTTLQEVILIGCININSVTVLHILASCPNLVRFQTIASHSGQQPLSDLEKVRKCRKKMHSKRFGGDHYSYLRSRNPTLKCSTMVEEDEAQGGGSGQGERLLWACRDRLQVLNLQYEDTVDQALPKVLAREIAALWRLEELVLERKAGVALPTGPVMSVSGTVGKGKEKKKSHEEEDVIEALFGDSLPLSLRETGRFFDAEYDGQIGDEEETDIEERERQELLRLEAHEKNVNDAVEAMCASLQNLRFLELGGFHSLVSARHMKELRELIPGIRRVYLH